MVALHAIRARIVLLDIEGTTTSISFVKDVLFPYAKEHTKSYLTNTWNTANTQAIVEELLQLPEYEEYLNTNPGVIRSLSVDKVVAYVNYLIDKDLKIGPLKTLQGLVWEHGYANGTLKGHVYQDVPKAFRNWLQTGLRIAIYSSGSVKAQHLLFGQTELGNLLPYISAHFDTAIGHKQEQQSYKNIATSLDVPTKEIVFLTDITKEAEAARLAGMQVAILNRPGNKPLTDDQKSEFLIVNDFDELEISAPN